MNGQLFYPYLQTMSANDAIQIFNAGIEAVKPDNLLKEHLSVEGDVLKAGGQTFSVKEFDSISLLCFGKASAGIAVEIEKILGKKVKAAIVVTKYHHMLPLKHYSYLEAGHPVPDKNSTIAAKAIYFFSKSLTPASLLICCLSGGASALLGDIAEGISLDDLQQLSKLLLQCGATIHEINTIRKHIGTLKGGRLVQQSNGAQVVSFIISDVLGDDISVIASGLTAPDTSTFMDAFKVLKKYGLLDDCPLAITRHIIDGMRGHIPETPKPGDTIFGRVHNHIIGSNRVALQAAYHKAQQLGYHAVILNDNLQGEAEEQATLFIQMLLQYRGSKPACFLMGGETIVTIKGNGKGGRNQHFILACMCELLRLGVQPGDMPVILSGGTDGTDGPTDAAGAYIDASVMIATKKIGLEPAVYLLNNDAYNLFKQLNALLVTGPTQTNVMDIVVAILPIKD